MSSIAVIGSGYVGLTTAACFAHHGNEVVGVDIDVERIEKLKSGEIPIFEDGLQELVTQGLRSGNLRFTDNGKEAVQDCEFIFLCLPTPQLSDGSADLSFVQQAVKDLATSINAGTIVVNKSTVPVGSVRLVGKLLQEYGAPLDVVVVSNPEFLREGIAVKDALNPGRIVVGSDSEIANDKVAKLYEKFEAPYVLTDPESAEMIKYASNAFLACKISFINEMSRVADAFDADIKEVAKGMGFDSRIGSQFLEPGPGYGGSCFPKDTSALLYAAEQKGVEVPVIQATIASNKQQFDHVMDIVEKLCAKSTKKVEQATIGIWGLAFKAGTDDVRESPACEVVRRVLEKTSKVKAFDPQANRNAQRMFPELEILEDMYEVAKGCDLLVVLTEWSEFVEADFKLVKNNLNSPYIFDTRNILDVEKLKNNGIELHGIGRHQI